jgi:hypothetical protein
VKIVNSAEKFQDRYQRGTPDIPHILMFFWFEPVLSLDPISKFQLAETTEMPGYFVGFADNMVYALKFKILKMTWSKFYLEV